jgi:hypothetical protein
MGQQPVTFGRRGVRRPPAGGGLAETRNRAGALASVACDARGDAASLLDADPDAHAATEEQMARFIGSNWEKYRDLWLGMTYDGALKPSFSIDAFAYSTFWLLYRRLYVAAVTTILLHVGVVFLWPGYLHIFEIGLSLCLGFWGKAMVVRRAMSTIDAIERSSQSSHEAALRVDLRIENAGGVDLISPAIAMTMLAAVVVSIVVRPAAVRLTETIASPLRQINNAL